MPADIPITLVPWFDAKDNPPKDDSGLKLTDQGDAYYEANDRTGEWGQEQPHGWYYSHEPHLDDIRLDPQPSVWCDPSPPDMSDPLGPLTVEDLRCLTEPPDAFSPTIGQRRYWQAAARLRRALEAAEKGAA